MGKVGRLEKTGGVGRGMSEKKNKWTWIGIEASRCRYGLTRTSDVDLDQQKSRLNCSD